MKQHIALESQSPLALSLGRASGFEGETLSYIPGATFRGAVANSYLGTEGKSANDTAFQTCFVKEQVRFTDLRPSGGFPWPNSVLQCASNPLHKEIYHAMVDLLVGASRGDAILQRCKQCDGKLEAITGYGLPQGDPHKPPFGPVTVRIERRMHSQVDPKTLKVKPGQFHSARTVSAQQKFSGSVIANGPEAETAWQEIWQAVEESGVFLGRGRSRGQGFATFSDGDAGFVEEMFERLKQFNKDSAFVTFSCDFRSHTLFYDNWLRVKSRVDGADLHEGLAGYCAVSIFSKMTNRGGWHAAAQLPKPETKVLGIGSCFLFQRKLEPGEIAATELARIAPILEELERDGCGERLAEGFGEAVFCHEIHVER